MKNTGFATIDAYHFILNWALEHQGNTPSQRQIAKACGFSSATAYYHTNELIRQGLLERKDGELCVVHAQFTLPKNAFEVENLQRVYPKLEEMKHIPKHISFREADHSLGGGDMLGIVVGDAADSEFFLATYPEGWGYSADMQPGSPIEVRQLHDQNGKIVATARFVRDKYEASIYFWGK